MKHILVVDDNKTNLMSAKTVLSENYKVTAVPMGTQALKFLEVGSCDLILLDIDMPEMDGFQVFDAVKKMQLPVTPPVVFLTGNTQPEVISRCINEGGFDVVEKPFIKEILYSRIEHAIKLAEINNI